jgi:hypothetical protein
MSQAPAIITAAALVRREIDRFVTYARQRSFSDAHNRRRNHRRYHRSWPLLVSYKDGQSLQDVSVALHDASPEGVGFLSSRALPVGALVHIKLFWHDESAYRVPATVRHATQTDHGWLIGCSFNTDDPTCEKALSRDTPWYG